MAPVNPNVILPTCMESRLKVDKGQIGLAGEFRVASEILRRGFSANITFGNAKATDIVVLGSRNRFIRVEVKTSRNNRNFVTSYFPKYSEPSNSEPDLWVLYLPNKDGMSDGDRFFLLTHEEVGGLQLIVNKGNKTERGKGVDNIPLKVLLENRSDSEDRWNLLADLLS